MRRIVLVFGLIAGGIMSAMLLLTVPFMDRIGFDRGAVVGYTSMVLAFLMIWFGVRTYRDDVAGGTVSFGRALGVGLLITAVASLCYVVTWLFAYHAFFPDFLDRYAAYALDKARAAGATEAQLAAKAREMAEFKTMYANPLVNAALTFLEPLPVGVLISLLSAWAHSRRRKAAAASAPAAA
jgi:hypothetical protein